MSNCASFVLSEANWVFGHSNSNISQWARKQALSLASRLTGEQPRQSESLRSGAGIVVGTPGDNTWIARANEEGLIDLASLGPDDHITKSVTLDGTRVVVIAGQTDRAAMYGVFTFFEQLGCRCLLSRDVLPEPNPGLAVPDLDLVRSTANTWRGVMWGGFCFPTNSIMSLSDYEALFDQMAKMGMNKMVFFHFENEPFIDFSFRGERKLVGDISHPDSGYISYGRQFAGSYLVEDIPVGREKFDRRRVAPLEFQDVKSSDEALDVGREFLRRTIDLAKDRGIDCWISVEPQFVPMNMTKYIRRMPRRHLHWSGHVSSTDPVADEINRERMRSLIENYPNAEGYFLGIPEGFFDDPYPESHALIEREWDGYQEALELQKKYWGKFWPGEELQRDHIRADIGFTEIAKKTMVAAKEIDPDVKLGILTICKAYLLTHLHKIFPKDMPFVDIESRSLWTLDGAPLHLFKQMEGRECAIIPRAVDDGSMAGLQFNLDLYQQDRYCQSTRENRTAGLVIQTTHVRGNEHNFKFLANGLWDEMITSEAFYRDYAKALFGTRAAETMTKAYAVLEENEVFLGGRGAANMPWNLEPLQVAVLRSFRNFPAPYFEAAIGEGQMKNCRWRADKWRKTRSYLSDASGLFEQALGECREAGRSELRYLITRTEGYSLHLNALILMTDTYEQYRKAFALLDEDIERFRTELGESSRVARQAEAEAARSAERFATCVEHPTDLGVLWGINKSMVIGTRVLRQFLQRIVAFYDGQEYWHKIDWDRLFGECPFPAHDVKMSPVEAGEYEPG